MSEWQSVNLSSLATGEVQQAADVIGSVADTIGQGISSASTALQVLSSLIIDVNDPLKTVIDNITVRIEALVNIAFNVLNTGVYFYHDGGPIISGGNPDGLPGFIARLDASLRDPGDDNRPQFNSSSNIDAIILCAGAEDIPTLLPMLKLLGDLFSLQKFNYAYDRLTSAAKSLPEEIFLSMSSPPDWYAMKMSECLPPLADVDEAIKQALGMIRTAKASGDFLSELAQILDEKANILLDMAAEVKALADRLASLIATPGLSGLRIQTDNGTDGFIEELKNAGNVPPWHHDSWVVGVVLLGGTGDFAAIPSLFGL